MKKEHDIDKEIDQELAAKNEKQAPKTDEPTMLGHAEAAELMKQLNEAEQKNAEYWDRIIRMQADMKNATARAEREVANAYKFSIEKFLSDLLPVIDNLERALAAADETPHDANAIIEGVSLTLKMLHDVLEKASVKEVNPVNEAFNPSFHEAISAQEQAGVKAGTVISVLQKGYLLNERLVRPALVVVAK